MMMEAKFKHQHTFSVAGDEHSVYCQGLPQFVGLNLRKLPNVTTAPSSSTQLALQ